MATATATYSTSTQYSRTVPAPVKLDPIPAYKMRPQYYPPGGFPMGNPRSLKKKMLPPLTPDGQPWFEPQPQEVKLRTLGRVNHDCVSFPANGWEFGGRFDKLQYFKQPGSEKFGIW